MVKKIKGELKDSIFVQQKVTTSESSGNIKTLQRSYASRLGARGHFTSLLVSTCSLDHKKHLFIYAFPRKYTLGINGAIGAQHHATGSYGTFANCHLAVTFRRRFTDGACGTLKSILRRDFFSRILELCSLIDYKLLRDNFAFYCNTTHWS